MPLICFGASSIVVLLICAFYTLFERHFLSHIQIRRGPKKVGPEGLLQPIVDGVKLFSKKLEISWVARRNGFMFFIGPLIAFAIMLIIWRGCLRGGRHSLFGSGLTILLFLCISGLNVYSLILAG